MDNEKVKPVRKKNMRRMKNEQIRLQRKGLLMPEIKSSKKSKKSKSEKDEKME